MIYRQLTDALLTFADVLALVGINPRYTEPSEQYAIRPGSLDEDDSYPGLVIAIPTTEVDGDLAFRGGFAVATVEIRAISLSLKSSWALAKAAAWNGGDPDDTSRELSGLDGYRDLSTGIQACKLKAIDEDPIDPDDKSDKRLWVVESTYEVHFDLGTIIRLENT